MFTKDLKIIIVGPAASGKDFLRKLLENKGMNYGCMITTRPIRDGEVEGVDYLFVNDDYFESIRKTLIVSNEYNGWKYGLQLWDWDVCNLFVMTPEYINSIRKLNANLFVIYLNPSEDVRRERLMQRNDADSVERRIMADAKQFANFRDYDIMITNPNF